MAVEAGGVGTVEDATSATAFFGWRMVAVAFVAHFVANGVTMLVIGNFVNPVSAEFGVAPSTVGMATGVAVLTMGLAQVIVGRALDGGRARQLMTIGAVITGLGLVLGSRASDFWQLAVVFTLLISLGGAFFGPLPANTLVTNWFVRKQGIALGFAVAGATLAAWPFTEGTAWLIARHDWRVAMSALGVICLVVCVPIFALLVIGRPEHVGQRPDGPRVAGEAEVPASEPAGEAPREAIESGVDEEIGFLSAAEIARNGQLWIAAVGFAFVISSSIVLMPALLPYGESIGLTGQQAARFFAAMTPFSLLAKFVLGRLADVAPLKPLLALIVVVNVAFWLILAAEPDYWLFIVAGAVYGAGIGGIMPVQGVLMARLFGRANFARANAIGSLGAFPFIVGAAIGSQAFLGATGSYRMLFVATAVALVIGGVLLAMLRIPEQSPAR